jgi:thioester reductase-like protein
MGGLGLSHQPFWFDCVMVLGPTEVPANGKIIIDMLKYNKLVALVIPPSLLEDIVKEYHHEFEKYCVETKVIIFGGGPLANFAGDYLSKHIPVMAQLVGSTECGFLPLISKESEYWQAFHFHTTVGGICFEQEQSDPSLYELVVKRVPGQEWSQGVFENFPDLNEWRTQDLYKKHPTRKRFWLYAGRADDMIVLSNGEKFIPIGMEHMISAHPFVKSGLVVGQGRFQCALIIELKDGVEYNPKLVDDVWPVIEAENKHVPAHAQISRDLIILADPNKPFQRASKGTIQRYKTVMEYVPEIDALYKAFESKDSAANGPQIELSSATDAVAVQKFLEEVVGQIFPGKEIHETNDLFVLGMDSLQTSQLSGVIKGTLKDRVEASRNLGTRFVYENPSIAQLKAAILALATGKSSGTSVTIEDKMRAMVDKYTCDLPTKSACKPKADKKLNVVLTGSTGSLGFYIILALLANPKIGTIYCLDRSAGCEKKFFDRWAVLGEEHLTPTPGRMHFYRAEFGHLTFGLENTQYSKIYNNANVIIHNAWKVNFNHPVSSFDNQIRSVKAFAHFSLTSPLHPEVCFVSSISAVGSYSGVVPESVIPEYTSPLSMGYGQSKYISERILEYAAREHDVNVTIFRVGQIGGPVLRGKKGQWNLQEWVPSLIKTSGELGLIPTTLGNMDAIDWIPADILGRVMVELVQLPPNNPSVDVAKVYNMVNLHQSTFTKLVPSIKTYYAAKGKALSEVPYGEWLDAIKQLGEDEQTLEKFPAKKIQGMFESLAIDSVKGKFFETGNLVADSDSMKTLTQVNTQWIETWLTQWDF